MENMINLVPANMLGVVVALYIIGLVLKGTSKVSDNIIPVVLMPLGVIFSICLTVIGSTITVQAVTNGIIQGIICAGVSVYCNQLIKQMIEKKDA